tara:strand:+ start:3157 stop:5421 length:2265 start_codon:yes stop_codon:yes gene_type:complete
MAYTGNRARRGPLLIRAESGKLLLPQDIGSKIENMYLTKEGTLRSIWGPAPYVPHYGNVVNSVYPHYGTMYGIFHARLGNEGSREVLLAQWNNAVYVFEGWNARAGNAWRALAGPSASSPDLEVEILADNRARFPPQWEVTPQGIVIIPKGENARPLFYDGNIILPLGYDSVPGTPTGWGPKSGGENYYYHTGTGAKLGNSSSGNDAPIGLTVGKLPTEFGEGRVGTIELGDNNTTALSEGEATGRVSQGRYRAAAQLIDIWGNLSPISGRSIDLIVPRTGNVFEPEKCLPQLLWDSLPIGSNGTVGRSVLRTKDLENADTQDLFELPPNSAEGVLAFATIPDNVSQMYPDNCPDSWLITKPATPVPVTPFKLYKTAFGRGWAANFQGDPGRLHPTMPGRFGTFLEGKEIYPDPRGAEITGLYPMPGGLLTFTETTTFLVAFNDYARDEFFVQTIHPTIGCVAPSSIAVMPDGMIIWLSQDGFYGMKDNQISPVSDSIEYQLRRINRARMVQACAAYDVHEKKYRCWLPMEASKENNVCWEFDGAGWTQRTDTKAADVCVTQDHRAYMLVSGKSTKLGGGLNPSPVDVSGVWLLDHQVRTFTPIARSAIIETCWIGGPDTDGRASPKTVYLWLRETTKEEDGLPGLGPGPADRGILSVTVERDWRTDTKYATTVKLYPTDDEPPFWGITTYGGTTAGGNTARWDRRRPYHTRADIFLPSCETFRLRIQYVGDWEFLGLSVDEVSRDDTFRSYPK